MGVAAACWTLALLVDEPGMLIPILGPLCAVSLLGFALGAADPALERITPQRWPRWRGAELASAAVAAGVALLPALAQPAATRPRCCATSPASAGSRRSASRSSARGWRGWRRPTAPSWPRRSARATALARPLTWPVQPAGTGLAFAAALGLAGAALHTRGPGPVLTRS